MLKSVATLSYAVTVTLGGSWLSYSIVAPFLSDYILIDLRNDFNQTAPGVRLGYFVRAVLFSFVRTIYPRPTMLTNQLTSPISGIVYQRDNNNKALVPVVGKSQYGTSVTITLTPVGSTKNPIKRTFKTNADGTYSGAIETPGGWYSLQSVDNTGQVFKIDTVGVGEVFILFGHSYMQGGHDVTHQLPSTDSRVRTLYDDLTHRNFEYGQLIVKVGPFHDWPDGWGQLGDLLVKRLNVPVLFYGLRLWRQQS